MEILRKILGSKSQKANSEDTYQPPPEALEALSQEEENRRKSITGGNTYPRGGPFYYGPQSQSVDSHEITPEDIPHDRSQQERDSQMAAAGDEFEGTTMEILTGEANAGMENDDRPSNDEG
jgi:hypothetical protein